MTKALHENTRKGGKHFIKVLSSVTILLVSSNESCERMTTHYRKLQQGRNQRSKMKGEKKLQVVLSSMMGLRKLHEWRPVEHVVRKLGTRYSKD